MKLNIGLKLIATQFALTLAALLLVSAAAASGLLRWLPGYAAAERLWICGLGAALASLLGWAVARATLLRRLAHANVIGQAWLRGNMALRMADRAEDELSRLTDQMDQLVQQLAHDEQDLAELRQREARLSDQVRALSIAEERSRLARELHDGVKQQLFSMALTASAIQDRVNQQPDCMTPAMAEMVKQLKTTAQTAQHEMTRLIEGLHPASIQERGLAAALNEYTLLFGAREHLLIYLNAQGNDGLLPISVAETLYLVAQEALNNVARHARATRVDVKLRCLPEEVSLTVRDNGSGFDPSQPRRGLGTASMQERLVAAGGRLSLHSAPGRGTTVIAQVGLGRPLPPLNDLNRLDPTRPQPSIANWLWLGQRLVIPVGQTWPWLPADEDFLRQPLLDPAQALHAQISNGLLGLGRSLRLAAGDVAARVTHGLGGFTWRLHGANWRLTYRSPEGRQVLLRNGQPLAAVQYQGRQMDTWSEFIYAGRGYRLARNGTPGAYRLSDEDGQEIAQLTSQAGLTIILNRPLPLNLLLMAALRLLEEKQATISH
jgi:NarL family two-component system sensor histidine kinase LiaS